MKFTKALKIKKIINQNPGLSLGGIDHSIVGHPFSIKKNGKVLIGNNFSCRDNLTINCSYGEVLIGDNVFFNDGCKINCLEKVTIGNNVMFGQNVLIYDHNHDYKQGIEKQRENFTKSAIYIGDDTWIGSNSIILEGVHIGNNCVIGAGTLVNKDIPDNSIVYDKRDLIIKERK